MEFLIPGFFLFTVFFWTLLNWTSNQKLYVKIIFTLISAPIFVAILDQSLILLKNG